MIKRIIRKHFTSFTFFYQFMRYKVLIFIALSIFVGILDGFGLAMFMPLLQVAGKQNNSEPDDMGSLSFILDLFETFAIPFELKNILLVLSFFFVLKGLASYLSGWYKVMIQQEFVRKI